MNKQLALISMAIQAFSLSAMEDQRPGWYEGGYAQKVAIALENNPQAVRSPRTMELAEALMILHRANQASHPAQVQNEEIDPILSVEWPTTRVTNEHERRLRRQKCNEYLAIFELDQNELIMEVNFGNKKSAELPPIGLLVRNYIVSHQDFF